jgi:hypothetical protein
VEVVAPLKTSAGSSLVWSTPQACQWEGDARWRKRPERKKLEGEVMVFLGANTSSVIPEFLSLAFYTCTSQEEPLLNLTKKNDDDFSSSFFFVFLNSFFVLRRLL